LCKPKKGYLTDGFARAMDVQSFSYDYWAYDAYHFGQSQWKPVGGGEAGSCTVDRGEYGQNHSKNSGYDSFGSGLWDCVQSSWAPAAASPFVYGNFLWTGFDCECAPARADVQSPNDMWCGVVWCGVVWCGVVWCGVVWCGVVWCGVVWCGVVWCGVVRVSANFLLARVQVCTSMSRTAQRCLDLTSRTRASRLALPHNLRFTLLVLAMNEATDTAACFVFLPLFLSSETF
jgi:hypothetical protein